MTEPEYVVVRLDDARCAELERAGWTRIAESWGARLRVGDETDLEPARRALAGLPAGLEIRELDRDAAEQVHAFDLLTRPDYPLTPQNAPAERDLDGGLELWRRGGRVFAAMRGERIVGLTVIDRDGEHAETDFTAVAADARRTGVAAALKAHSVLTLAAEGVRTFGTGGAAANTASIRMNETVGYRIEERWVSLQPPQAS